METNVLDWLETTAAACPDKPAFLDEDSAVTFCLLYTSPSPRDS